MRDPKVVGTFTWLVPVGLLVVINLTAFFPATVEEQRLLESGKGRTSLLQASVAREHLQYKMEKGTCLNLTTRGRSPSGML